MRNGLGGLMKQAQEMQNKMKQAQEELARLQVTGESGGGLVKVTMTCRHDVRKVDIDEELIDKDDKEVLEDLIAAALNDAVKKVEATTQQKMSGLTAGINIPGLNLPF